MLVVLSCRNVSGGKGILSIFFQSCFKKVEIEARLRTRKTKKLEERQRCGSLVEHLHDMCLLFSTGKNKC